jgi:hypothetical protein
MIKIFKNEDFLSIYFCPKLQEDYCTSQNILENFDFELIMKENERLKFELEKLKAERIESNENISENPKNKINEMLTTENLGNKINEMIPIKVCNDNEYNEQEEFTNYTVVVTIETIRKSFSNLVLHLKSTENVDINVSVIV